MVIFDGYTSELRKYINSIFERDTFGGVYKGKGQGYSGRDVRLR